MRRIYQALRFPALLVGLGVLAFAVIGPALATNGAPTPPIRRVAPATSTTGPFLVTDSSDTYAIKGSTTNTSAADAVYGYASNSMGTGMNGVTGYVVGINSVGVVGYSSATISGTGNVAGTYGFSQNGNGIYGLNGTASYASIYGLNTTSGGTAMWGQSTSGAGYGVIGSTATGAGVEGLATGTAGNGGYFASQTLTGGQATLGVSTGEAGIFAGRSGSASHPALSASEGIAGTDLIGGYNAGAEETFIVQAGTADASGDAAVGGSPLFQYSVRPPTRT